MGEAHRRQMMGGRPQQVGMQVNVNDLKDRVCACGCKAFAQLFGLKELPILMSNTGHAETIMLHIGFACLGCGTPMSLKPGDPGPGDAVDVTPQPPDVKKPIIEVIAG